MGKGAKNSDNDRLEVLIEGKLYDVSNFKHPGGSVIKYLTNGGDATEAFVEFHNRSKRANLILKSLPSRVAPPEVVKARGNNGLPALTKDYLALRRQLEEEGFFKPAVFHMVLRFVEIFAMHLLGAYLFMTSSFLPLKFLGLAILGVMSGRCGWLMHEGGHYSITGHIPTDRFLQIFLYGVGCGMSAAWWRNQHNKHHATPQKLKHDVDLDTLPLVAFNAQIAKSVKSPLAKWWLKHQAFLFTPFSCLLVALGWQYYLHPRHILRTKRVHTEGLSLVIRHLLFFGIMCRGYTWPQSVLAYAFYNCVAASYIFSHFALSHTHLPVSQSDEYLHWVEYASIHTMNVKPNFAVNWIMGYLNFQIEHHLFPGMAQCNFPVVSKRVRELYKKHGMKYDERPYFVAMRDTWENLSQVADSIENKKQN